jgi:hypothetical protein
MNGGGQKKNKGFGGAKGQGFKNGFGGKKKRRGYEPRIGFTSYGKGLNPSLPFLDIPRGVSDPDGVREFLRKMMTYADAERTVPGLSKIFLLDKPMIPSPDGAVDPDTKLPVMVRLGYPTLKPPNPLNTPEGASKDDTQMERERWKMYEARYIDKLAQLEEDKLMLYGVMVGQLSNDVFDRCVELPIGRDAEAEKDPLGLVDALIESCMLAGKEDSTENYNKAHDAYHALYQIRDEPLPKYYQRSKSALASLRIACEERYGVEEALSKLPDNAQQVHRFIKGLNYDMYGRYKEAIERGDRERPYSLDAAYTDVTRYGTGRGDRPRNPQAAGYDNNSGGANNVQALVTSTDSNGGRNKKKHDFSKVECFNCHQFGHYQNKCPHPRTDKEIEGTVAEARAETAAGGGKKKN